MKMHAFELELLDVVSVRDGRSFDAGGASLARALWPPTPWTMLGAVRARLVLAMGGDPTEYGGRGWVAGTAVPESVREIVTVLGRPEDPPRFGLGPVLMARGSRVVLYPSPLDWVAVESGGRVAGARLEVWEPSTWRPAGARCSSARDCVLMPPMSAHPGKRTPPRWVDASAAAQWLSGQVPPWNGEQGPAPEVVEPRIGIGIDPAKGCVQEGMFYQRMAVALREEYRLMVPVLDAEPEVASVIAKANGLGELGGDRHGVRFSVQPEFQWPAPTGVDADRVVLWFLSPVRPEDLSDDHLGQAAGSAVHVLAVASGRPLSIGGFAMWRGRNRPRPMRRYYPAGTCVYVEGKKVAALHGRSVAADASERAAGFGVCLCGAWPPH